MMMPYNRRIMNFLYITAFFIIFIIFGFTFWTKKFFGYVTLDQAISTVYFGVSGALAADSIYIKRFIKWCIISPIISCFVIVIGRNILERYLYNKSNKLNNTIINGCLYVTHPVILFILSLILFAQQFQVYQYIKYRIPVNFDYFASNYRDPKDVLFKATNPKNLILIYAESYESSYKNKDLFKKDLLNNLSQWEAQGLSFKSYQQMKGTGWTIAGLVATQCSIPLKQMTIFNGNRFGENINYFLPNATCLSDILSQHGYKNIFLGGASSLIGGKGKFLSDHHYDEIYDKERWVKSGFSTRKMTAWGLSDYDLFEHAKIILQQRMNSHQLFNLTILTVDTHGDLGQLSQYCHDKEYRQFSGIIECTAAIISDFLTFIKENNWQDKVNVVIIGDHLAMKNPLSDQLNSIKNRSIYNLFLSTDSFHKSSDEINSYSLLPTLLHFIGFHFEGKVGLGYSAIFTNKPSFFAMHTEKLNEENEFYSKRYASLWRG